MRSGRAPLALIAGPTASGKSALAVALARHAGGVVINADASQVYRDLRILTARPSPAEEALAPHRLFGHVDGAETCTAARWADDARREIAAAHDAGRLPILVGGTGLYLRTLIEGIAPIPSIDPAVRAEVRAMPLAHAYGALAALDPATAAALARNDTTRVTRALEVVRSTGRTIGDWRRERTGGIGDDMSLRAAILLPDRAALMERCDVRLSAMFDGGAREEVAALLARDDVPQDAPVRRAIGVPEVAAWIAGSATREESLAAAQLATRRYAKRQYTWFRRQPPPSWRSVTQYSFDPLFLNETFLFSP